MDSARAIGRRGESSTSLKRRVDITGYGAWALIAGASEGLGAAYARALASRGLQLVLIARRRPLLDALECELRAAHGIEIRCVEGDLADDRFLATLPDRCADLDLGILVYNAAHAPVGEFVEVAASDLARAVDVNVRAPLALLRAFLPGMASRGRGAVVLMTSLAGNQGAPRLATYAATKAFNRVLAEGLWHELRRRGIDVVACCAGAVRTPGYAMAAGGEAPGTLDAEKVVEKTLRALGRGPVVIPGLLNKTADALLSRLLPRRTAIAVMAGSTEDLAPSRETKGES